MPFPTPREQWSALALNQSLIQPFIEAPIRDMKCSMNCSWQVSENASHDRHDSTGNNLKITNDAMNSAIWKGHVVAPKCSTSNGQGIYSNLSIEDLGRQVAGGVKRAAQTRPEDNISRLDIDNEYQRSTERIPENEVKSVTNLSFPAKLHMILSHKVYGDIISWMPHGRSWRVHNPKSFEKHVLPNFFIHKKYSSFLRQAERWGFRRMTKGPDSNSYFHELFMRGHVTLGCKMASPKNFRKQVLNRGEESDLYPMSKIDLFPGVEDVAEKDDVKQQKDCDDLYKKLVSRQRSIDIEKQKEKRNNGTRKSFSNLLRNDKQREYLSILQAQLVVENRLSKILTSIESVKCADVVTRASTSECQV